MSRKNVIFYFTYILFSLNLYGQICTPENLAQEKKILLNSEIQESLLQRKLQSLIQEFETLSHLTYEDDSQKKLVLNCIEKKKKLFTELSNIASNKTKESPEYLEAMGDFYSFNKDLKGALVNYDQAIKINPKNFILLIKAYDSFLNFYNIKFDKDSTLNVGSQESRSLLEEASRRAQKISEHPEANNRFTKDYLVYQALVAQGLAQNEKEIELLERVVTLDPQNSFAIRRLLNIFVKRNDLTSSTREFNKLIRKNLDSPRDWETFFQLLVNNNFHQEFFNWFKKATPAFKEKHPALKVFQIKSLIELGRIPEAKQLTQSITFKIKEPLAKIDRQNKSRINEIEADDFKKQGRLSEALDSYKKALSSSPNPLTIKEKISLLIYEYRKSLNFKPFEATQKDLQEVTELLYKSAFETELKSNLFEIYLNSLKITQNAKILPKACERFSQLYPAQKNQPFYKDNCLK